MPVYRADELFKFRIVTPREGTPAWMNLVVDRHEEWRGDHPQFQGPGLYGAFLDDALFYVGLYAGKKAQPFGGSVFDRWHKHIAYQIGRSPDIHFTPARMYEILSHGGVFAEAFRSSFIASGIDPEALDNAVHPLIAKRNRNGRRFPSCTPSKIRFAEENWGTLNPDVTDAALENLMSRFKFVYQQWPRSWSDRVSPNAGQRPGDWVISNWLAAPEAMLIEEYNPVCNHPTRASVPADDQEIVTPNAFATRLAEIVAEIGTTETPFVTTVLHDNDCDEAPDPAEEAFLDAAEIWRWSETLVRDLISGCPNAFDVYFTDKPDLRIGLKQPYARPGRRGPAIGVLLTISAGKKTGIQFQTCSPAEVCAKLGFKPSDRAGHFAFDPERHIASDLFSVAGAALAKIIRD